MSEDLHPVAIAHFQGMEAGKAPEASPYSCPWPAQDYEAVAAWFAGFSLGILVNSQPRSPAKVHQPGAENGVSLTARSPFRIRTQA